MKGHGLTTRCINIGMKEIDDQDYRDALKSLLEKKWEAIAEENLFKKKDKVARHAIMKGFEPDLVWGIIKELSL